VVLNKIEKLCEREMRTRQSEKASLFRSCSWVRRKLFGSGGDGDG